MKKIFVNFAIIASLVAPLAMALPARAATPDWNITGTWNLDFNFGGGHYLHTMTVTTFNSTTGAFSGTGVYSDPSYTWTVTGIVSGYDVTYHIVYTGTNAGYTVDVTGTIASGGTSMSGTWGNASQSGTWTGVGAATAVLIGPPTDKDQCKKDGWKIFNNPTFKNQGDCVSFVASKGKAKGNE